MGLTCAHRFCCKYCFWNRAVFTICMTLIAITILICVSVLLVTILRHKRDQRKHENKLIEAAKAKLAYSYNVGIQQGDTSGSVDKAKLNDDIQ